MSGTNGGYGKNRPRFTDAERQDVLTRHDAGESVKSIAATYDVTDAAIYYHLKTTLRHVPVADRQDAPPTEPMPIAPSVLSLAPQGDWVLDALCAEIDHDIFFPDKGGSTREAKGICIDCPVAAECLDYALANNERFGIWGGLSERERRRLTNLTEQEAS